MALGEIASTGNRSEGEVDAAIIMTQFGQAIRVKARSTGQIQDSGGPLLEKYIVNPAHLQIDPFTCADGNIAVLAQMAGEHAMTEARIVPGNVVSLCAGGNWQSALNHVGQGHGLVFSCLLPS